jgi:hypothetical protein
MQPVRSYLLSLLLLLCVVGSNAAYADAHDNIRITLGNDAAQQIGIRHHFAEW